MVISFTCSNLVAIIWYVRNLVLQLYGVKIYRILMTFNIYAILRFLYVCRFSVLKYVVIYHLEALRTVWQSWTVRYEKQIMASKKMKNVFPLYLPQNFFKQTMQRGFFVVFFVGLYPFLWELFLNVWLCGIGSQFNI